MLDKLINSFKPKKKRVVVVMGGPSSEHEVSLATGKMVLKHLDPKKYEVTPVKIDKDGRWSKNIEELAANHDLVFIAMHGEYGEDGRLQKELEKHELTYTGSSAKVSKDAMDKSKTVRLLKAKNITCPDSCNFKKHAKKVDWKKMEKMGLPLVVKPADRGSSVGVMIVNKISDLAPALQNAFAYSNSVMVEKYIRGRELTCGVLEVNGVAKALPPTEIIPKRSKFFDYKAKYTTGASKEVTPPENMSDQMLKDIQQTALKAYKALGCRNYARVDFILADKLHVLEVNTLPGLTKTSLLPQAAKAYGIDFRKLLDIIIDNARN